MPELSTKTEIELLKSRMINVEDFVKTAPDKFVTEQDVQNMIAQSVPSREDFKADMTGVLVQHLSVDNQSKRNTRVEIVKAIAYVIGGGTIGTIALALLSVPK